MSKVETNKNLGYNAITDPSKLRDLLYCTVKLYHILMIILELQKFVSLWPQESFVQEKPVLESPTVKSHLKRGSLKKTRLGKFSSPPPKK